MDALLEVPTYDALMELADQRLNYEVPFDNNMFEPIAYANLWGDYSKDFTF